MDRGEVIAPPLLCVKALDMVMDRLVVAGVDFSTIEAVSGAGQVIHLSLRYLLNKNKTKPGKMPAYI